MDTQSSFMFLSICNETLGLSPEQVLDSDFVMLMSILRERNFMLNERNKDNDVKNEDEDKDKEWVEKIDFETGKLKRVEKVKNV